MPRKIVSAQIEPMESIEDKWVRDHGEAITYAEAVVLLKISKPTIGRLVRAGYLQVTPTKRILVRSAAAWANSNQRTFRRN